MGTRGLLISIRDDIDRIVNALDGVMRISSQGLQPRRSNVPRQASTHIP